MARHIQRQQRAKTQTAGGRVKTLPDNVAFFVDLLEAGLDLVLGELEEVRAHGVEELVELRFHGAFLVGVELVPIREPFAELIKAAGEELRRRILRLANVGEFLPAGSPVVKLVKIDPLRLR